MNVKCCDMKRLSMPAILLLLITIGSVKPMHAQVPVADIIKAAVKKVIKAVDLQIQRLQNKTIWLQNAQKVLENKMSKLKLTQISDWANKQKELYAGYFDELWKIKNDISSYHLVKEIIAKQIVLAQEYSKAFNLSKRDKNFTPAEIDFMEQVYTGILNQSLENIDQLQLVIKAYTTHMSDAKRLVIIHAAEDHIDQNLADLRQFNQRNIITSLQRSKERNNIDAVRHLYGIE